MITATITPKIHRSFANKPVTFEIWVVIAGNGKTVVDGMEQQVKVGDVITMEAGCRHTIIAEKELKLIEVQLGKEISVHDKQKYPLE